MKFQEYNWACNMRGIGELLVPARLKVFWAMNMSEKILRRGKLTGFEQEFVQPAEGKLSSLKIDRWGDTTSLTLAMGNDMLHINRSTSQPVSPFSFFSRELSIGFNTAAWANSFAVTMEGDRVQINRMLAKANQALRRELRSK